MLIKDWHFETLLPYIRRRDNSDAKRATTAANSHQKKESQLPPQKQQPSTSYFKPTLMHINQIPVHLQFNKFILTHYRPATNWIGCVRSLFYIHNETVNIVSHGVAIFVILFAIPSLLPYDEITVPYLPVFHVVASISTWIGSTLYHLFMNHQCGYPVYKFLLTLDVIGIWITQSAGGLVNIVATIFCLSSEVKRNFLVFYGFLCVYCLYKALTAKCVWSRRFCYTAPFLVRVSMLLLRTLGFGGGDPDAFPHLILQDAVAILGGILGATHIPERWFPGSLDLFFNSHHLMHVMALYAVYQMHLAVKLDLNWMSQMNNNNNTECMKHIEPLWEWLM